MGHRDEQRRWQPRPILGALVHGLVLLVPVLLAVTAGILAARLTPTPADLGDWISQLAVALLASTAVLLGSQRVVRRLLPLAFLLKLTMVFPGASPSRWKVARDAGRLRDLEAAVEEARTHGLDDDPTRAARQVLSLVAALSGHDRRTRGHSERVRVFTDLIAAELRLPTVDRDRLRWAALLHDIGKLKVPASVLNKPGRPTDAEWRQLRRHPVVGADILTPLAQFLGPWVHAARDHHERWDGEGYPEGRSGPDISYAGRIVAVADAYEVMTTARAYKRPMSAQDARSELVTCAGTQFDAGIVKALLAVPLWRLRWSLGPMAWVAQLPLLRDVAYLGRSAGSAAASLGPGAAAAAGLAAAVATGPALAATGVARSEDPDARPGSEVAGEPAGQPAASPSPSSPAPRPTPGTDGPRAASPDPAPSRDDGSVPPSRDRDGAAGDDGGPTGPVPPNVENPVGTTPAPPDGDTVRDTTEQVVDVVEETTEAVTDTVQGTTEQVTDTVGETTEQVTDTVEDTVGDTMGDPTGPGTDAVEDIVQDPTKPVTHTVGGALGD